MRRLQYINRSIYIYIYIVYTLPSGVLFSRIPAAWFGHSLQELTEADTRLLIFSPIRNKSCPSRTERPQSMVSLSVPVPLPPPPPPFRVGVWMPCACQAARASKTDAPHSLTVAFGSVTAFTMVPSMSSGRNRKKGRKKGRGGWGDLRTSKD